MPAEVTEKEIEEEGKKEVGEGKADTVLARKLAKVLEWRVEGDRETVEALKELSTFLPENTLRARRNLRGQIERRSLAVNQVINKYC